MHSVILLTNAQRFYADADATLRKKVQRCLSALEADPTRGNNVKPLTGEFAGYWRYRMGDWRVIYRVDSTEQRVYVVKIAHRREVYE